MILGTTTQGADVLVFENHYKEYKDTSWQYDESLIKSFAVSCKAKYKGAKQPFTMTTIRVTAKTHIEAAEKAVSKKIEWLGSDYSIISARPVPTCYNKHGLGS